ncbi:hypothetical protein PIIN_11108, partial [Serendipita indica DSM 11827]
MSTQKSTKRKKQRGTVNPSTSPPVPRSTNKKRQVYDMVNIGLDIAANIAEGSEILAPLKAACRTTKSILEVAQATENNQEEWTELTGRVKGYMSTIEEQIALFETYPPEDMAVNEAFKRPLAHYVKCLEDMHDKVVNLKEKRSLDKHAFSKAIIKVKIDAEEILKLNRDIEDRHSQFMDSLGLFTAWRIQSVERNTKVIKADVKATKANMKTVLTDVDCAAILQLPTAAFVASSVHRTCLTGTREAVLQTIYRWAGDITSDKPIFWLCDIAGSGKSTVAMSAADAWKKEG